MIQIIIMTLGIVLGNPSEGLEIPNVNLEQSKISWKGAKVGGEHVGEINLKEANLIIEEGTFLGGSFVIDMTSITNTDLSGEYKSKLEGHLKSEDFFSIDKYPTSSFNISSVIPQGGESYKIVGDLTIKGITKEIKFPATLSANGEAFVASATITIDRSDFNVKYGSGSFFENLGDKVIYDEFELSINILAY